MGQVKIIYLKSVHVACMNENDMFPISALNLFNLFCIILGEVGIIPKRLFDSLQHFFQQKKA